MEPDVSRFSDYRKVLEDHQRLKSLLDTIHVALTKRSETVEDVSRLLGQLGDHLIKHFALEEDGGYFADALTNAPQLLSRANELLAQHPKMSGEAKELVQLGDRPHDSEDWWTETTARFEAFKAELLKHEQLEDGLLQEAYQRDIGATD